MKLFAKLKNDKKGFTLVEMIVVIVIIGILLAILVPGMFKYIDKAKDKQIEVNARTAYMNLQTAIKEIYAMNGATDKTITDYFTADNGITVKNNVNEKKEVSGFVFKNISVNGTTVDYQMLPLPNNIGEVTEITVGSDCEIATMTYSEGDKSIKYSAQGWSEVIKK